MGTSLKYEFIYTKKFDNEWEKQGLLDEDQRQLELYLVNNPEAGDIMQGTGGLRKIRWGLPGKGKSGGIRVLYLNLEYKRLICMVDLFPKNEKENLSQAERNTIKQMVKRIEGELTK